MDSKQFHRRVWALVLLLAVIVTSMGATLYDLQINNGQSYYEATQKKIAESQTVGAARGQILDRNGQVLVSNRVIYQVRLDTSVMDEARNDIILDLIAAARTEGVEWTDTLPITRTAPFSFTTSDPYFVTGRDEEGNVVKTLTRLGRLAVRMKWIEDPTADAPAPEPEEAAPAKEPGLLDRIKGFLKGGSKKEEAPPEPEAPKSLPTAEELLGKMCESFALAGEGAADRKSTRLNSSHMA